MLASIAAPNIFLVAVSVNFCRISATLYKLARLMLIVPQASKGAKPKRKTSSMKPIPSTQPETKGTMAGATISLLLLVAFGLSSYLNQQDQHSNYAAAEHSNRPTIISAYLA
jgi:hypothetical protein